MKIVVFGPRKRTGALIERRVIDLSHAYAKYLRERTSEPSPLEMADVVVPSECTVRPRETIFQATIASACG